MTSTYRASRAAFPLSNPDWREPYAYVDELPDEAIAFEFLRRNVSYWKSYAEFLRYPDDPMKWPERGATLLGPPPVYRLSDDKQTAAMVGFGVRIFCDPRAPIHYDTQRIWRPAKCLSARYVNAITRADAENQFNYVFGDRTRFKMTVDLMIDGPVEQQIDFVRWALKRAQKACFVNNKHAPRFARRYFPLYLALLDARSDGATYGEIAKSLSKGRGQAGLRDRLRKQYAAAARLRDGDYLNLLSWGKITIPSPVQEREPVF